MENETRHLSVCLSSGSYIDQFISLQIRRSLYTSGIYADIGDFTFYKLRSIDVVRYTLFSRVLMYRYYFALTSVVLLAKSLPFNIFVTTIMGKRLRFIIHVIQTQNMIVSRLLLIYSAVSGVLNADVCQFSLSVLLVLTPVTSLN